MTLQYNYSSVKQISLALHTVKLIGFS